MPLGMTDLVKAIKGPTYQQPQTFMGGGSNQPYQPPASSATSTPDYSGIAGLPAGFSFDGSGLPSGSIGDPGGNLGGAQLSMNGMGASSLPGGSYQSSESAPMVGVTAGQSLAFDRQVAQPPYIPNTGTVQYFGPSDISASEKGGTQSTRGPLPSLNFPGSNLGPILNPGDTAQRGPASPSRTDPTQQSSTTYMTQGPRPGWFDRGGLFSRGSSGSFAHDLGSILALGAGIALPGAGLGINLARSAIDRPRAPQAPVNGQVGQTWSQGLGHRLLLGNPFSSGG